jgi:hypothetical protein
MENHDIINYESLVRDYNESLNSVLRGFRPKLEFLELWVPDADHLRSVKNLVESARDQGHESISLFFSQAILKELNLDALVKQLQAYGKVEQEAASGGKTLHLNRAAGGKKAADINPLYEEKITELSENLTHQGSILEDGDNLLIRSTKDGISLFGAINTSNHTIHRARHSGTNKTVEAGLLEGLCRIIEGLPIQEAFEHGIIKLEHQTRSQEVRSVKGIANVFNYPAIFELPSKLLRDLYETYVQKTGYKSADNFYHPAVTQKWKAVPEAEKITAMSKVFDHLLKGEGTPYSRLPLELHVMGIEGHHKVNIGIQGDVAPEARAKLYMDFEKALRAELDPGIEVFSQNIKDRNAIRRMTN